MALDLATALDAPDEVLDEQERRFVSVIRQHGWFVTQVSGDEQGPGFSYTTGFWLNLGHPELVIFGLENAKAYAILSDIWHGASTGKILPLSRPLNDVIGNLPAQVVPVSQTRFADYLGWSCWFYGDHDFPCVQIVWPDPSGAFPWQLGFDDRFSALQPDLSDAGWSRSLSN